MNVSNLNDMIRGWIVGNFDPSILKTDKFEVGVKRYKAGDYESSHYHKLAMEITIISDGEVMMNGNIYKKDDIIVIEKGEATDFKAITDCCTVVIRDGSFSDDKYNL